MFQNMSRRKRLQWAWKIGSWRAALFDSERFGSPESSNLLHAYKELKSYTMSLGEDVEAIRIAYNRAFETF